MKRLAGLTLLLTGMLLAGCASPPKTASAVVPPKRIVTPDTSLTATVAMYDAVGRFVVLNFPVDNLPKNDQVLFLYRAGLKVGEVKVTGPQRDNSTVADLTSGEAKIGDEVRDQ